MPDNTKLTIGLFGFGVVGEGIYKVLQDTGGLNASIKKVCIKHPEKQRNAPAALFTTNANELLDDPDINVIVELIDDADSALSITQKAFANKKAVVSANKKMIANHLAGLLRQKQESGVSFLYEAAVCGSVPIIRNLEEYYDNDLLNSFTGIVNGSTNFILTKINEEGLSYHEALVQAQQLGFAESNPALDVEGIDAVNKLAIILKHTYGIIANPESIFHTGITRISQYDSIYAEEKGYRIKLLAVARKNTDNTVSAYVIPTFVNHTHPLYNVRNEYNGVLLGSRLSDEQFLYGKGAGRYPTASAVLSDIAALRYNYNYEYKKSAGTAYHLANTGTLRLYVSGKNLQAVNQADFISVDETYKGKEFSFITGEIALQKLHESEWVRHKDLSVIQVG